MIPGLPLPLFVTGITGVAGYNAFLHFRRCFPGQVIGIRPNVSFKLVGEGIVALDSENIEDVRALFRAYRFGSVLNCLGNCALKSCELDPNMARQLNVASAETLARNAREHGCRLVHLSSDLVYSGIGAGNYVETDPVDPVTVYGKTMAEAETLVREIDPGAALLRISLPMGPSFNRHAGAIDWIESRFRAGRPATLYFDEVRSCTYVDDLNRVCARFLSGRESGIYHAGGPTPVTLYQIGQIVNRVGGYEPRLLHGCPRLAAGPMPPRAGNVSMLSAKLDALMGGCPFQPWPVGSGLFPTDRDWHRQRPADEQGSVQRIRDRLYAYPGGPGAARKTPMTGSCSA